MLDEALDPVAVGVSGAWGSGKTTVLKLIERGLKERTLGPEKQFLIVSTDPWRYDPAVGAKESLIAEILAAITTELENKSSETTGSQALKLAKKLAARVQWTQAIKMAATTALTLQLPKLDQLTELIAVPSGEDKGAPRGLDQFRAEFTKLMTPGTSRRTGRRPRPVHAGHGDRDVGSNAPVPCSTKNGVRDCCRRGPSRGRNP